MWQRMGRNGDEEEVEEEARPAVKAGSLKTAESRRRAKIGD